MKNTIPQIIAAIGSFLSLIAVAPAELQDQIPQVFPDRYRGLIAVGLGLASFLARSYSARPGSKGNDSPARGSSQAPATTSPVLP